MGCSVVLDATFSLNRWRDAAYQMAGDCDANLILAECECGLKTIRKRLRKRDQQNPLSDARIEHLPYMLKDYQPSRECRKEICIRVRTDQPKQQTLRQFLANAYRMQEAQIQDRLRGCKPAFVADRNQPFDAIRI